MSGPPKEPTALKILKGNPGKKRLNLNEPKPPPSRIGAPAWLADDPIALEIWQEEAPELIALGLLTSIDRLSFAALCERAATYRRAAMELRGGLILETKGPDQPRAEVSIARGALYGFVQLAARFGMSPSDRARLTAGDQGSATEKKWAGLVRR